ncbi:hypothetical protein CWC31_00005, partial [Pseudoalteromonas ruthenica]|uniref:hypothetical protein n=1 Tax=Pseudoalteromonas ruthenica TaxID=151081 RepID=UPI00127355A2
MSGPNEKVMKEYLSALLKEEEPRRVAKPVITESPQANKLEPLEKLLAQAEQQAQAREQQQQQQ